jgi:RNA 2',3'-cyclic 3'-phosphodiesterase
VGEQSLKLFFALWPDADTRAALNQAGKRLHKAWGGRRMHSDGLHLTLAFLGDTPTTRLDELRMLAATIAGEDFTLSLDRPGCWQHNHVGWLGASEAPAALEQWVSNLTAALQTARFSFDRRPFVPHVTVLRNAHCAALPVCQAVVWRAEYFALLASRRVGSGGGYEVLGEWPLSASIRAANAENPDGEISSSA